MMNKKFANPYIIYYPVVSRDGMPFPVNRTVRDIQEELNKGNRRLHEDQLWRGNLVAAKFADNHFVQMMDASMADFPILKNFLATHPSPIRVPSSNTGAAAQSAPTPPTPPSLPPLPPTSTSPQQQQQQQLHAQGFPAARQAHMQYTEPAAGSSGSSSHPPAYEREPAASSAHGHGVPGTVLTLRRDPRTAGAEQQQYIHPMEL